MPVTTWWSAPRGAAQWVIVADEGSDAGRLYRAAGFTPGPRAYGYHAAIWR